MNHFLLLKSSFPMTGLTSFSPMNFFFFSSTPWPPTLNPLTFHLFFIFTATRDSLVSSFLFSLHALSHDRGLIPSYRTYWSAVPTSVLSWFSNFHPLTKFRVFTSMLKSLNVLFQASKMQTSSWVILHSNSFL